MVTIKTVLMIHLTFWSVAMWYICETLGYDSPLDAIQVDSDGTHFQFDTKEEALASEAFANCQQPAVFEPEFYS